MQQIDAGALEVTELESWLDAECPCEAKHSNTTCSEVVVARAICCVGSVKCCQNWVVFKLEQMSRARCRDCGRAAEKCWRIIPI
ncbi:hypothetical protein Pan2_63 [Pseudanabaena phage Pan2]|nr:hypothetical protein Pan2_63 [Pseudanabaena phage Pan2]